jgi:hypothetical protein
MAQKVQTLFIDDLDGSEADGTVRIGLDGTDYEIDLNAEHIPQLRRRPRAVHQFGPPGWRQHPESGPQRPQGPEGRTRQY